MATQAAAAEARNLEIYEKLKKVRASKTVELQPTPMLRKEVTGFNGELEPFHLRYYQVQGIFHLLMMKRMILGDGTGLGKTLEIIGFLAYLWARQEGKVVVVAPKSALRQWESEIERFATGITTYVIDGKPKEREKIYQAFLDHEGDTKAVLVLNYHLLVRDWNAGSQKTTLPNGKPGPVTPGLLDRLTKDLQNLIVVYDECTAFKNVNTKTWQVCHFLSERADRVYGLTATLLKNNLIEGFAIYKCICPFVFKTKTRFLNDFCVTRLQPVGGGRKIPIIVGYRNLDEFRAKIDPYFLGRSKHLVSDELPTLITREVVVKLTAAEDAKYSEALSGVIQLGDGTVKDYEEHKAFVALMYCQQITNSLSLLKFEGGDEIDIDLFKQEQEEVAEVSSKERAMLDLLTEEFEGEKVIVYTRFASLVPRLQELCKKNKIKNVAITGKVKDTKKNPARQKAQKAFQDTENDVQVIFITDAGGMALNLQAAKAMIFFDAPWSWGDYVQLLGRPIRIGSPHQHVVAIHLVSERPRSEAVARRTIDHYTLKTLQKKKKLVDRVLGESAAGALDFGTEQSFLRELVQQLKHGGGK